MPLTSGTSLGAYEIVAPLGAGGMGEVYQARDTQLGRDVALKILPSVFAHDRDRLARFEREAQTLASLNHPNIAAIYGIESSTPVRALVMELVPGRTLDQAGHFTVDEAISVARQIAEALEAAHERGVIHRDLKPSNVKVRDDGTVKLLDFGLAKALTGDAAGGGNQELSPVLMNSPTMTSPAMTQHGIILGTAAYMAPEQAKGKALDRRADVWAFGVLLYEMLTDRRLFDGESISETLAAVLRQDIDLKALPADTPVELKRLVARCLDRDPRTRLRDIGEARVVLSGPMSPAAPPELSVASTSAAVHSPWRTRLGWLVAGLVIGAGAWVIAGASRAGSSGDAPPPIALSRLTDLPGPETQPDISPDGRQVLYTSGVAGNSDIYLLRVGGARAINLTAGSTANDEQGRFSPTGDQIVFRSNRDGGGLFVMGATGESVKRLTTAGFDPAWSPDGRFIAYSTEGVRDPYSRSIFAELWTVEIATGKTSRLFAGDAVQPAWSPDSSRLAFWANSGGQRDIWTISASGGEPVPVTKDLATDWSPDWSPDGRALYFVSDRGGSMNVWRVRIDRSTGRTSGDPQPLTTGVRPLGYVRLSKDGSRMIAAAYDVTHDLTIANFDAANPERIVARTTLRNQSFSTCDPSPDGAWLACASTGAREDIVLIRSDGMETRRLMDDEFKDRGPRWSPDGKTLGFYSTRGGRWESWSIHVDGSDLRQLTNFDKDTVAVTWAPDGQSVIVTSISTGTAWRIDTSRMNTIDTAQPLKELAAARLLAVSTWSPDGALVAGEVFDTPLASVVGVWDLARGTLRVLGLPFSNTGTSRVTFLPDSRRLLAGDARGLFLIDLADGQPRLLRAGEPNDAYSLSRDGRTLVIDRPVFDSDIWLMELSSSKIAGR